MSTCNISNLCQQQMSNTLHALAQNNPRFAGLADYFPESLTIDELGGWSEEDFVEAVPGNKSSDKILMRLFVRQFLEKYFMSSTREDPFGKEVLLWLQDPKDYVKGDWIYLQNRMLSSVFPKANGGAFSMHTLASLVDKGNFRPVNCSRVT
jgi:hypothetical protein